jgi:hypothetical protein
MVKSKVATRSLQPVLAPTTIPNPANASGDSTSTLIRQRRVLSTAVEAYEIKLSSVATRLRELEESTKAKDEY